MWTCILLFYLLPRGSSLVSPCFGQISQKLTPYFGVADRHSRQHQNPAGLFPLFSSSDKNQNDDNGDFMEALRSRIDEVQDRDTKLPIVILDSMLPRQVFKIEYNNPIFIDLVRKLIRQENPSFGMIGMVRLTNGQQAPLQNGVEVQIINSPQLIDETTGVRVELRGMRRMRIVGELETVAEGGWTEGRVRYLDDIDAEEKEELSNAEADRMSRSRAIFNARNFTSPNEDMPDNTSLVDRWIQLARENERNPGQIDQLLEDLGEMPPAEDPTDRSMWVGALINPLPGMGVAMEIRPSLLMARTAEERVNIALEGILASIKHMDGSKKLF